MNRSSNSHSSLFLMEMMIAILFFSLVSAVCLRMFTKSHQMSEDTRNLNMAINQIQNAAELLKYSFTPGNNEGDTVETVFPEQMLDVYPNAAADAQEMTICFDTDWNHCQADDSAFCMKIRQKDEEISTSSSDGIVVSPQGISAYEIVVLDAAEKEISSLEVKLHRPNHP